MSRRSLLLSLLMTLPVGCSGLHTGRTYLSEMEQEDSSFFNPREDFPVVAGDTGRDYITDRERRSRTPASESDQYESRVNRALKSELRALENAQPEETLAEYDQHKKKLATTSERIYFLKLPPHERNEYLLSRGFIAPPKTPFTTMNERMSALRKRDILLGMTKDEVLSSWGKPQRVEIAGNPRNENERWLYQMHGAPKYIYFESGEVQGWE